MLEIDIIQSMYKLNNIIGEDSNEDNSNSRT
jgi:hypothetical protein